jgi:hypothetical protein
MSKQTYDGSITLSKLKSVITERQGKSGMVKGIFIPFEVNYLTVKENAVYLNVRIIVNGEPDKYDQNGFIAQKADTAIYKAASDALKEELKKLPILGNFRDFSSTSKESDQTTEIPGTDDLPF